jgi:hypothetical protein
MRRMEFLALAVLGPCLLILGASIFGVFSRDE